MSYKSFFKSLKGIFWFGSGDDDLIQQRSSETEVHDVFFLARDVTGYEEELEGLEPWFEDIFDEPGIALNDPDSMEDYIDLSLDVKTEVGNFRLVYYENDELVLRGDREIVIDLEPEISQKLDLEFKRV